MSTQATTAAPQESGNNTLRWLQLGVMLYLLLVAVSVISGGFKLAVGDQANTLFEFASHPIAGLMIGVIATALTQSSSTTTSITVGLVAGGLPVETAIPMIMGANIGTTTTNTLVSLGHARCKEEFSRAFSSATIHDVFNLIAVAIFLPLEIMFGLMNRISEWLVSPMMAAGDMSAANNLNFIKPLTSPGVDVFKAFGSMFPTAATSGIAMIVVGIATIMIAISIMGKLMRKLMVGRARDILKSAIGRGPLHGIASGSIVTILVQSSSTTTSLMVPLVGTNVLKIRDVYPFTVGANIGTCITALIASTATSGEFAVFALQIALVHLAFNVLATLVIFGIPFLRELPIKGALFLGQLAAKNKLAVLAYLVGLFVVLPGIVLALTM